jgi:hypothetical protein
MVPGDSVAIDGVIRLDNVAIDGVTELGNVIEGETIGSVIRLRQKIEPLDVTENGVYEVPESVDGFNPVTVSIPEYDGAYTVEPSMEEQILATAGKVMTEDVTIAQTDLYPLWTDIVGLYAGRNTTNGKAPYVRNHVISDVTGEVVENNSNSVLYEYLRVSDNYTYCKNNYRLYGIWCYDADKNYIGRAQGDRGYNNLNWKILPQLPQGTHYIRIVTHQLDNNYYLAIYRTA